MAAAAGKGKARKPKNGAGEGGDGRDLSPEDNLAAIQEAERVQLLSYMAKLRDQRKKTDAAKTAYESEKAAETEIFRLAKAASGTFTRERLNRYLGKMGSRARNLVEEAQIERRHEGWLGLPTGDEQMQLFGSDQTPASVKDEAFWRAEGYMAYHRGDLCSAPEGIGAFNQPWIKGWQDAETATAFAMQKVEEAI